VLTCNRFFTIIPTIYGVIVYRRLSAFDDYHHPHNAKHYGFSEEPDVSYNPTRGSINVDRDTLYDPASHPDARPRRPSFTFRRNSSSPPNGQALSPVPPPLAERRASYDHRRDTQFDDYVAQRASVNLKDDVEHALGAEFGWEDDRRDSVIGGGVVPSAHARTRGNSVGRAASWEVNIGTDTPTRTEPGVQRGHSLVCVPEIREEEYIGEAEPKGRPISDDRQGLLGNRRISELSVQSFETRDSRIEPVQNLEDVDLDSRKRRRDS
jgi:hypothetical protein